MRHDVTRASLERPEPRRRVGDEQPVDEILRVLPHERREEEVSTKDHLIELHRVVVHERRVACEHLVHENPDGPPVDRPGVPHIGDDLGGKVLGRAAQRERLTLDL
eukprot:CAMPEP_0115886008 /NCGR_PEP_ID=MMETSP0287-20121206/30979_1 /TAXON_ID=412157 /ORGANISM="Chrysochromulina rotalis, Strain UIO044" /LENGTH=105 /DNA_ID=CAMNT_0003342465 /DNA_START=648 /DNA_END=961 /DNA_ORIENTATION=-